VDHRVDVFAAGVLLYGMLVGHPPFQGSSETVMYKVVNEQPTPPSQVPGSGRPVFYDGIVAKALAKKPADRYASVAEFRAALAKRDLSAEPDTGETTVIVVREDSPPAPPVGVLEPPSGIPHSGSTPIAGWDAATLQQVEVALASFVGPMARVMVRQAARVHRDLPGLQASLCEHLPTEPERQRFLAKFSAATGGSKVSGAATRTSTTGGSGTPISPETLAAATRVLSSHIGPIASIVVKKAAAKARTQEQLYMLLGEQVGEGSEREKLLAALRKAAR